MYSVLLNYIKDYPQLQPTDLLKFCYQSVFGPGHMAPGREMAEKRIADFIYVNVGSWLDE